MKFGISLVNRGELARPEILIKIAQLAEARNLDSLTLSDHVVIPKTMPSNYPYHPEGAFDWKGARDYYEPLTTLAFLAGATRRIRLGTSVLIISYRNPVLVAKMVSSADALSGGRVFLGVGAGWWEEEYQALGIGSQFAERGARTDEYLRICRNLWREANPEFQGQFFTYGNLEFSPKPLQSGGVPLWIGGHTTRALRRTAELGDAWHPIGLRPPAGLNPAELGAKVKQLHTLCEQAGRDPGTVAVCFRAPIVFSGKERGLFKGTPEQLAEDIRSYGAQGVDHVTFDLFVSSAAEMEEYVERLALEVVPLAQ